MNDDVPHNIYKLIDPEGVVRYIGITKVSRGEDRFEEHYVSKPPHTPKFFDRRESEYEAKLAEAEYKEKYQTHRSQGGWNGIEGVESKSNCMSQMGALGGKASGSANIAKMPKETLRENGRKTGAANLKKISKETLRANAARIPKETLRANGRKNIAKIPKETLREGGRKTGAVNIAKVPKETLRENASKTNTLKRERQIASYVNAGIPLPTHLRPSEER